MKPYDLIVVGAGPAGMMAAGQAAQLGTRTLLVEKMASPGRKLLLTGKGRCNLTNTAGIAETLTHFNRSGRFLKNTYYRFFNDDLCSFFNALGVPTKVERGGRVFPASDRSRDILEALQAWMLQAGVELLTNAPAHELILDHGRVQGLGTSQGSFLASRLILATGGKSYPGTGSSGDGYALARLAGHSIQPLRPSLVPLVTAGATHRKLQGLSLKNVTLSAWMGGQKIEEHFGEMLFTHFGLSGPVVLSLSRRVVPELERGKPLEVRIDLKPALDHQSLENRLLRDIQSLGKKNFSALLEGLLPRKLIPVCLEQTGLDHQKKNSQISSLERNRLISWLKDDFKFEVTGQKGFQQAVITAGGIETSEIDPRTMESRLISGLYFAGEILDMDADTGGFNLQAAFSTGWAAGQAAGK